MLLETPPVVQYHQINATIHRFHLILDDGGDPALSRLYEFEKIVYKLQELRDQVHFDYKVTCMSLVFQDMSTFAKNILIRS